MPQITQLDNDPTPNNNDLLVTVDMAAGTTKNISREQFFTGAPLPAGTVDSQAIDDGAVTAGKIANNAVSSSKIQNSAVTPEKRSGGFYAASVTFSAGTGAKSITGFGFKPKEVQFICRSESGGTALTSLGGAVDVGGTPVSYVTSTGSGTAGGATVSGTPCMIILAATGTQLYRATFTSFNADGVTINVTTDGAAYRSWTVIARG